MIYKKDFRIYFRVKNGANFDYYYEDTIGAITFVTSATPTKPIVTDPKGIDKFSIRWDRADDLFGVFVKLAIPFEFVGDGAKILKHLLITYGFNFDLEIYIERFNPSIAIYDYEYYFKTAVNLSTLEFLENKVKCDLLENGIFAKVKARRQNKYDIDVTDSPYVTWVKLNGINFEFRQKWIGSETEELTALATGAPTMSPTTSEGSNLNLMIGPQGSGGVYLIGNQTANSIIWNISHHYDYFLSISNTSPNSGKLAIFYLIEDTATLTTISNTQVWIAPTALLANQSQVYSGDLQNTITLPPGSQLSISFFVMESPTFTTFLSFTHYDLTQQNSYIEMSTDQKSEEGYVPCISAGILLTELVSKVTDNEFSTDYFLTEDHLITCGDALRNLDKAVIKISLDDVIKSYYANFCSGVTYGETEFNLNSRASFYDATSILEIPSVNNFEFKNYTKESFSVLNNGYSTTFTDEVNGKDEYNVEVSRTSPITRIENKVDLISTIRTDVYGIETIRLNLAGKKVIDSENDNDVFMIHIDLSSSGTIPNGVQGAGQTYYDTYIDASMTIENVYSPQLLYNFYYTPLRCLRRHGTFIRSAMFGLDDKYIKFQSRGKSNNLNTHLKTTEGALVTDEGSDILISDLNDAIYKPFIFKFNTYTTIDIKTIMETNPYGYVEFYYMGNLYSGYILSISQNLKRNSQTELELLCTSFCDISTLIN